MRYVVYGAGAIGGVLGARLHQAGHDVVLVARGEHLRAIRGHGLTLLTPGRTQTLAVPAVGGAAELTEEGPVRVLLAVKSQQTHAAVEDLVAAGLAGSTVVSVQNGVANEPFLARFFADVQAVCVMMPAAHLDPGVVEQHSRTVPGILDVGRFPGGIDATSRDLAQDLTSAGFVSEPRADLMAWKHRKLVVNLGNAVDACCVAGPGADELTGRARAEGEAVLGAAGIPVVSEDVDEERRSDLLTVPPSGSDGRAGSSSWQSLQRATGTIESDYLNGEIVLLGRLHDLATPVNELLRRTAVDLAREGRPPGSVDAADLLATL